MSGSDRGERDQDLTGQRFALAIGFLLALLVAGVVFYSSGRQDEYQHQKTISAQQGRDGQQQAARDHAGVPAFAERFISNSEPKDAAEREERDLAAQENTATWAFWVVLLSFGQLALSGLGLAALLETIKQGRAGLARAAESNSISTSVANAELRPYLFVDRIELVDRRSDEREIVAEDGTKTTEPEFFAARVCVHLHNYGKVPARNIQVKKRSYLARFYQGRIFQFHRTWVTTPVCAPGHERRVFDSIYIPPSERSEFDNGVIVYVIRMRFTYEDDAGRQFSERADHYISGDDLETFYLLLGPHKIAAARQRWAEVEPDLYDEEGIKRPPKRRRRRKKQGAHS